MSKRVGSGLPNIQKKSLQEFSVRFPINSAEQQLLGSFFFSLDSQITLHTQRLEKLKQIKSACLDNMFV
jgi:type I restriction enzyme S subunit